MKKGGFKSPADFHDDSSEYRDAYSNLNKTSLAQNSKIFNDRKLNDKECTDLLNKVIFLLNQVSNYLTRVNLMFVQGESFPDLEKSSMFFNVTKLFATNPSLH